MSDATDGARPRKERPENAARRRGQMIAATLRSVARDGLAGVTLATVARQAGLSQGSVVFYFRSKDHLLAEAFRAHYAAYEGAWRARLEAAGPAPLDRLLALVAADFDPAVFNPEALAVWHGFWGQASARPVYAEIAETFDRSRARALTGVIGALAECGEAEAVALARAIEGLSDGLWLRAYLGAEGSDSAAMRRTMALQLSAFFPAHAETITRRLTEETGA